MWNKRYGMDGFAYGREPNDHVAAWAEKIPSGPVLCLAAGEGRNAVHLASLGHEVTAVDASQVGLSKADALAKERGVALRTTVADLDGYLIERDHYAAITAIFCHLPPALRQRVHEKAVAGLKPGGLFILEGYTPAQLAHGTGGPPVEALLFELSTLRDELEGLEIVHGQELEREIAEGQFHRGLSAVVQIVARRPG